MLNVLPKYECRWDFTSLGEVILRFDAGSDRIHTAREFRVFDGGNEYHVARALRKVFGLRTGIFSALAKNPLGRLLEDLIMQGGVDASQILWREPDINDHDALRNGVYFTEAGCGMRAPHSYFDRSNAALAKIQPTDFDWKWIFGEFCSRWFHTGSTFVGLTESTAGVAHAAMQFARKHRTIVSYESCYLDSLWKSRGGCRASDKLNENLFPFVDVLFTLPGFDITLANFEPAKFADAVADLQTRYPNIKVVATILRDHKTGNQQDLSAVCFADDQVYKAQNFESVQIYDRGGSDEAFAAGFVYGLLAGKDAQYAVDCGAAHAVLAVTTPGENSMASLHEIEDVIGGKR